MCSMASFSSVYIIPQCFLCPYLCTMYSSRISGCSIPPISLNLFGE